MLDGEGTVRPESRRGLLDRELDRYDVNIAALSEIGYQMYVKSQSQKRKEQKRGVSCLP